MKVIKRLQDLPASFSIEKYIGTASFTIVDWVIQLEARAYTRFLLGHGRFRTGLLGRRFASLDATFHQDAIIRTEYWLEKPIQQRFDITQGTGVDKVVTASHIADMTAFEYWCSSENDSENELYRRYVETFKRCVGPPGMKSTETDWELLNTPEWKMHEEAGIDDDNTVHVSVDLHGSEEKILADFALWLRGIRKERGIKAPQKRFGQRDFSDWASYQILAYLDLTSWAEAHECEITQQILGVALFPGEYNVNLSERIRKVVRPLAIAAAHEASTDALRSQALAGLAESKPAKVIPE